MVTLTLSAGDRRLARSSKRLADGARYTAVAVPGGDAAQLRVYRDGEAQGSTARWRMVHAAPEIDSAEAVIDGRDAGPLDPGEAQCGEGRAGPGHTGHERDDLGEPGVRRLSDTHGPLAAPAVRPPQQCAC